MTTTAVFEYSPGVSVACEPAELTGLNYSAFAGWTQQHGFRVHITACPLHEPKPHTADQFGEQGLSWGEFRELVDALTQLRDAIDADDVQFVTLQRFEGGRVQYVEVDPRALNDDVTE